MPEQLDKMNRKNQVFLILFLILILININLIFAENKLYYEVNLNCQEEKIKIDSIKVIFSKGDINNFYNEDLNSYSVELTDNQNKILEEINFSVPNVAIYDMVDDNGVIFQGGSYILNETDFELYIPYFENSKELVIYNKNKNILEKISVSQYSKQDFEKEDFFANLEDSQNKDFQKIEKENKEENLTDKINNNFNLILALLIAILIVLIVIIIYYYYKNTINKKR
jgi:hypothetical protein